MVGNAGERLPEIIIVSNGITAFFKPHQEANAFEFHTAKCLRFRASLGICFSFTAYMTH